MTINTGLNFEEHTVTTSDGYINKIFRIYNKKGQKPAVLMVHGLVDSANTWIVNYPEKSQPFILAKKGYDVWLANTRGNRVSLGHVSLDSSKDLSYWDRAYSNDIAKHDIPAFINFAKKTSKVDKITVVAHSQGSQMMFYNLVKNQSYILENVNLLVTLAPIAKATTSSFVNLSVMYLLVYLRPLHEKIHFF